MEHHDLLQASASYPEISVTLSETGRDFFFFKSVPGSFLYRMVFLSMLVLDYWET